MSEFSYNSGNWVDVDNLGELRKYLQLLPDSVEFKQRIRLLETIDETNDCRNRYSIQMMSSEDKF